MSQNEFDNLLEKYLQCTCTPEEEVIVLQWHQALINTSKVELTADEKDSIESRVWNKLSNNLFGKESIAKTAKVVSIWTRRNILRFAVAASFITIVATGIFYYTNKRSNNSIATTYNLSDLPKGYKQFENKSNQTQSLRLSDGSLVQLRANSVLYYPILFVGETRDVYLHGSAFFDVTHNQKHHFFVHSNAVETEVLGTSFEITREEKTDKIEVAVKTGKVSVYEKLKKIAGINISQPNSIVLTPNQRVSYNPSNSQFVTSLVELPQPLAGLENKPDTSKFQYQDATLPKVFSELQSAYGISINMEQPNMKNCHFTGDITKQDLYKKLDIICKSTHASYELKGTIIFIKGGGCK